MTGVLLGRGTATDGCDYIANATFGLNAKGEKGETIELAALANGELIDTDAHANFLLRARLYLIWDGGLEGGVLTIRAMCLGQTE